MRKEIIEIWDSLERIKIMVRTGGVTYLEGKKQAQPHLKKLHFEMDKISKSVGDTRRHRLSFAKFMR